MIKLTLARRVFIYFLIVILISLAATAFITYWQSSREFDQYMYDHMSQTMNNAVHHTNIYLEDYERAVFSLLANEQIKKFVSLPANAYYDHHEYGWWVREYHFRNALIRNPEIASIYLLSNNGQYIYVYGNTVGLEQYPERFDSVQTFKFLDSHTSNEGLFEVFDHSASKVKETGLLTVARRVSKLDNIYEFNGVLALEVHKGELESLWKGVDLGEHGFFYVVNNEGRIIYHPTRALIGTQIDADLQYRMANNHPGQLLYETIENEKRALLTRPAEYAGWNLVVSMPLEDLRKPINNIRRNTIYMSIITLVIALLFATQFGKSLVGPVRTLKQGMLQTEQGNWVQLPLTGRNDEMDDLTRRFNMMVSRLSGLVDKVYKAEIKEREIQIERQKAEFQALQLQVNPHFLYNTLETIACYAVIQDSKEITGIVKYLADMFRYAVKTDIEEVTIANELKHVLNYLQIINYRTGGEFEIEVPLPPEYLLRNMVRLTLQPLVENAFQHAFPDGLEKHHYIRIDGYMMKDNEFIVTVEDNGAGITEEKLIALNEKLELNKLPDVEPDHKGGIGLVNVHRRIQMVFGEQYGLAIESKPGQGTKMLLRMPRS
jgi:two-component system, sensor histidine kinase YesM